MMTVHSEFATVDLIVGSSLETRGVDAFVLALIKAERQMRKLFTHLVMQYPCFTTADIAELRTILAKHKRVYFEGFEAGINQILWCTVEELIGESYKRLRPRIAEAILFRNKIFHGQLTHNYLTREDLFILVRDIRDWCYTLAEGAMTTIAYDGFDRDSLQKSKSVDMSMRFRIQLHGIESYAAFIAQHMVRQRRLTPSTLTVSHGI